MQLNKCNFSSRPANPHVVRQGNLLPVGTTLVTSVLHCDLLVFVTQQCAKPCAFCCMFFQAEVCSGTVAEVIQSVVNGADGCIFCFGQANLGKTRRNSLPL